MLPRTLEAFKDMVNEKMEEMQEPSHAPTMMGQPLRGRASSMMQPTRGMAMRRMTTRQRRFGKR